MHMVCKRDLNSAELETMRILRSPTTVMTANGEVLTREEATVYVKELDFSRPSPSSVATTRPPLFVGERKVPHEMWLWPSVARNPVFPPTTVLQLRTRSQTGPTALGTAFLPRSGCLQRGAHPLSCSAVGHHSFAEETPWWCRWPAGLHGAAASRQRQPPNVSGLGGLGEGGPCRASSRSWTPWRLLLCAPVQQLTQERAPDDPAPQPEPGRREFIQMNQLVCTSTRLTTPSCPCLLKRRRAIFKASSSFTTHLWINSIHWPEENLSKR